MSGGEGAIPISRILVEWEKTEKSIVLKGAIVEGDVVGEDGVRMLATIPDRPTLIAQICCARSMKRSFRDTI